MRRKSEAEEREQKAQEEREKLQDLHWKLGKLSQGPVVISSSSVNSPFVVGRRSFGWFNPAIQRFADTQYKLMRAEKRKWRADYAKKREKALAESSTADYVKQDESHQTNEAEHVSAIEMARRFRSLVNT